MSDERDIIKETRDQAAWTCENDSRRALTAAADEIERLRAEVARLNEQNSNLRKRLDLISGWAGSIAHMVKGGALPLD